MFFFFAAMFLNIVGCVPLIIGAGVGAVGGYAISRDTIQGDTDRPYDGLWDTAINVGKIRGTIIEENKIRGYMKLEADSSKVWITFIRLTRATTRTRVSARKHHFPNLGLAQDIYVKIMNEAN
jgi:hypothetical protein